jgi:hypothetical protein
MTIPIQTVKEIREQLGLTHVVILGLEPDGTQHVATHGETEAQARQAAEAGNKLKASLGWPESLCKSKPVARQCANCVFFRPDYGIHCVNGWSGDGSRGDCLVEPGVRRVAKEHSCMHFSPKG